MAPNVKCQMSNKRLIFNFQLSIFNKFPIANCQFPNEYKLKVKHKPSKEQKIEFNGKAIIWLKMSNVKNKNTKQSSKAQNTELNGNAVGQP